MKTVHKYPLPLVRNRVETFEGARFLHAAEQHGHLVVWAEVNTLARECLRTVHVAGTGTEVPPDVDHIGSLLAADGDLVFHVYGDREETR